MNDKHLKQLGPCSVRVGNVCPHLAEQTVIHFKVSKGICDTYCPKLDGPKSPRGGAGKPSPALSIKAVSRGLYGIWLKAIPKNGQPRFFQLPDISKKDWAFLEKAAAMTGGKLWLGGSCIREGAADKTKDIDAIVCFESLDEELIKNFWNTRSVIRLLPSGRRIDWSWRLASHDPLLPVLDKDAMIVYGSPVFIPKGSTCSKALRFVVEPHMSDKVVPSFVTLAASRKEEMFLIKHGLKKKPEESKKGLGDMVARTISWLTGGKVKPCGGCSKRKKFLNEAGKSIGIGNQN